MKFRVAPTMKAPIAAIHAVEPKRCPTVPNATSDAVHRMFDHFVHDSLAGFNHRALEPTGYWRYRKGFLGSPKRLTAENDSATGTNQVAATG